MYLPYLCPGIAKGSRNSGSPGKMRYSICRPGVFFAHGQSKPKPKPSRRPGVFFCTWAVGVRVYVGRACFSCKLRQNPVPRVVEDWGPSVCRPGVFGAHAQLGFEGM